MPETIEPKYKVKVPKLNVVKKKFDFSLSLPGMISAVGAGVLALTFFFVMGILIGRGYRPEADVPPLNQMMPNSEHGRIAEERPAPGVLTSEELDYQERLKAPPQQRMDNQIAALKPAPIVKTAPAVRPVPTPSSASKPEVETSPLKAAESEPTAAKSGEPVFNYVYQVASFRKVEMAEDLSRKLAASGLRTSVQSGEAKGSTWHRVQVLHHGTPASTDDMKAVLAKYGIKKPLLKKKTASK